MRKCIIIISIPADLIMVLEAIMSNFLVQYARVISEKSLEQKSVIKRRSKFSCEIVLEFQK